MALGDYRLNTRVTRTMETEYIVEFKQNGKWKNIFSSKVRGMCLNHLRGKTFQDLTRDGKEEA